MFIVGVAAAAGGVVRVAGEVAGVVSVASVGSVVELGGVCGGSVGIRGGSLSSSLLLAPPPCLVPFSGYLQHRRQDRISAHALGQLYQNGHIYFSSTQYLTLSAIQPRGKLC